VLYWTSREEEIMAEFDILEKGLWVGYDPRERYWNSRWNTLDEVNSGLTLPKTVSITDSTLREGEEAPFVVFTIKEKLKIARMLDEIGVHEIDCGFAAINEHHFEFLQALGEEGLRIKKSVIVRVDLPNYESAIERVLQAGADVILCGLYATPIKDYSLNDYLALITRAIGYCKDLKVFAAFWGTCTRWERNFVESVYKTAIDAGADRIKIAGGGVLTVPAFRYLSKMLKTIAGPKELGIHAHNHYGLATAYALAGVEAGAENVETSVNGLGDGAGLAPFEEVVMALTAFYGFDLGINIEKIMKLSRLVQRLSGVSVQPYKPLVGNNVFVETPDTHIEAILRKRLQGKPSRSYINPEAIGQRQTILFGPSALGGPAIELKATELGMRLTKRQVDEILGSLKKRLATKPSISEGEVEKIIQKMGKAKGHKTNTLRSD
jgi:isopropylmalate/homocitrate/citramalate synthase